MLGEFKLPSHVIKKRTISFFIRVTSNLFIISKCFVIWTYLNTIMYNVVEQTVPVNAILVLSTIIWRSMKRVVLPNRKSCQRTESLSK